MFYYKVNVTKSSVILNYILCVFFPQAILECMRCMTTADEEGMMAALETVNDSLLKMTSTLTELSRESFNNNCNNILIIANYMY